jgi:hypothetical protein
MTFKKEVLKLSPDHQWNASPGHNLAVIDRGAVRFEIPRDWVCAPDEDSVKFLDVAPPHDRCRIAASRPGFPSIADQVPIRELVQLATQADARVVLAKGDITAVTRGSLELAWIELRVTDPEEHREAVSRLCLARDVSVYTLITSEFWVDESAEFSPVWDHVLETLRLGELILDPTVGQGVKRNRPETS